MTDDPNKPDFSDVESGSSSTAAAPAGDAAEKARTDRTYTVQGGDSLSKIAKKFYGETLGLAVDRAEEMHMLRVRFAGDRHVIVYAKPDHQPATFTVLNFPVADIEATVDALTERGVQFQHYEHPPGFDFSSCDGQPWGGSCNMQVQHDRGNVQPAFCTTPDEVNAFIDYAVAKFDDIFLERFVPGRVVQHLPDDSGVALYMMGFKHGPSSESAGCQPVHSFWIGTRRRRH